MQRRASRSRGAVPRMEADRIDSVLAAEGPPIEILEHTADAGIVARGATLAAAFAHAAEGMYGLMVDTAAVKERTARTIDVRADDPADLLVAWLLELLFLTEAEGLVFRRFAVDLQGGALHATAYGELLDEERHAVGLEIKAVTRHLLAVQQEETGVAVRVLFDV